jgi:outer membrane biosynthesis protein TonB
LNAWSGNYRRLLREGGDVCRSDAEWRRAEAEERDRKARARGYREAPIPRSAWISLACGIVGLWLALLVVPALVAIILGHKALREIRKSEYLAGAGVARAGLTLGYMQLLLVAFFLCARPWEHRPSIGTSPPPQTASRSVADGPRETANPAPAPPPRQAEPAAAIPLPSPQTERASPVEEPKPEARQEPKEHSPLTASPIEAPKQAEERQPPSRNGMSPPAAKPEPQKPTEPDPERAKTDGEAAFRLWKDASGKYTVEARFRGIAFGNVRLQRNDGTTVSVPIERLSEEDQQWLVAHKKIKKPGKEE